MDALAKSKKICDVASDKMCTDIILMDTGSIGAFASYFVICSTESERQTNAVAEETIHILKQENEYPLHTEGETGSGWVIVDYGDVVLHIFSQEERDKYRLEEVWKNAKTILRID